MEAPAEIGTYSLGVKVADRVGNVDEELKANRVTFSVVDKPIPRETNPKDLVSPPPKIYTHTLVVTVTAVDLANVEDLSVTLTPADTAPVIVGNIYTFRKLKGDVSYQVSASGKIKSGISAGDELSASGQASFPAQAISSQTQAMALKLSR
jgi:hypothetical protein